MLVKAVLKNTGKLPQDDELIPSPFALFAEALLGLRERRLAGQDYDQQRESAIERAFAQAPQNFNAVGATIKDLQLDAARLVQ